MKIESVIWKYNSYRNFLIVTRSQFNDIIDADVFTDNKYKSFYSTNQL